MTSMLAVRKAVIDRLTLLGEITGYWHVPEYIETPAVLVMPDFPPISYEQSFSKRFAEYRLVLTLVVDRIDEEYAQEQLSEMLDPTGPIIGALRDRDRDDALAKLSRDVRVTTAGDFNEMTMGGTTYYYAQVRVTVRA